MSNPSETIAKKTVTVVIGEEQYVIGTFSFAKTLKLFGYVAALTAAAKVKDALGAASEATVTLESSDGETILLPNPGGSTSNFISTLLDILPVALSEGVPAVFQLIGLLVTSNKELKRLERDSDVDTDAVLREKGEDIAYDATNDEMFHLVGEALQVIGIETIIKAAGPLVRTLLPQS